MIDFEQKYNPDLDAAESLAKPLPGFGLRFNPHLAKQYLLSNIRFGSHLSEEYSAHLLAQNHRYARVELPYPVGDKLYEGPWVKQAEGLTCMPTSLSTAFMRINEPVNFEYLAKLLNLAKGEDGISFHDLEVQITNHPDIAADFFITRFLRANEELQAKDQRRYEKSLKHNAGIIKSAVDNDEAILLGLTNLDNYLGVKTNQTHAITLTGYSINKANNMDVQVVDGDAGRFFIGLEHLFNSFGSKDLPIGLLFSPHSERPPISKSIFDNNFELLA